MASRDLPIHETPPQPWPAQPYGDVSILNVSRMILDAVGHELLTEIVAEYLTLLETSAAVYERNGDYALGIFSSGWCRVLDARSRELCGTPDNREALACGTWHCHESCWSISKASIEQHAPVDLPCLGGLRIFAVPIHAGGQVVGSINFGYGPPPRDPDTLRQVAERYHIPVETLRRHAEDYAPRPDSLIALAKSRTITAAKLIGALVERKQAEDRVRKITAELDQRVIERTAQLELTNRNLLQEIDERHKAEQSLQAALVRLQELEFIVEKSPAVAFLWRVEAGWPVEFVSANIAEFGYIPDDFTSGRISYASIIHGEDLARVAEEVERYTQEGRREFFQEYRILTKNGETRWLEDHTWVRRNQAGQVTHYQGLVLDITERKRLEEQRAQLAAILESTTDFVAMADADGHVTYMNRAGRRLVGFGEHEDLSRFRIDDKDRPSGPADFLQQGLAAAARQGQWAGETMLTTRDGRAVPTLQVILAHHGPDGAVRFFSTIARDITERKQVEEKIKASRDFYLKLLDNFPTPVWRADIGGQCDWFNRTWLAFTGRRMEEELGDGWLASVHPEDRSRCMEDYLRAFRARKPFTLEYRMRRHDGTYRWFLDVGQPFHDLDGNFTGYIGSCYDFSDRKEAETELSRSRETLRLIVDNIPEYVFWKDRELRYLGCNRLFAQSAGAGDRTSIVGKNDFDLAWKETAEQYRADDRAVMDTGIPKLNYEEPQDRPDGSILWLRTSKVPLVDQTGQIFGVLGVYSDITGQKRIEQALRESEEKFRAIADSAQDAVIMLDNDGRISYWNPAAERTLGHPASEALGRSMHDWLAPPRYRTAFETGFRQFRETGTGPVIGKTLELAALRPDGTEFPVELSVAAVKLKGQWNAVGILRDISARKAMEAQAGRLERMAAVGQLLGGLAHELKNPLFILTGGLQLCREKLLQREYGGLPADLDKLETTAARLSRITERFLSLAKPYQAHLEPSFVQQALHRTLELLANELDQNRIVLRTAIPSDLPATNADPRQLQEVFLNLMMNAMQAMAAAHGRGTLTVSASLTAEPPGAGQEGERWIEVRIADDGPGIAPEHRHRLFEPFFSTKPPGQGTGMGLWTVRTILMPLRGTIACETEPGKGATFIVRLPVIQGGKPSPTLDVQAPGKAVESTEEETLK